MKKLSIVAGLLLALCFGVQAQNYRAEIEAEPAKSAGLFYTYPDKDVIAPVPAPAGYEPVYLYHFGRHGSRYREKDSYSKWIKVLEAAGQEGALTPRGKQLLENMKVQKNAEYKRYSELSEVGFNEQRRIAGRLYNNYPEVFRGAPMISASSTYRFRALQTMDAFCERLKELNPKLDITRTSSKRDELERIGAIQREELKEYLSEKSWWWPDYLALSEDVKPERFVSTVFTDPSYLKKQDKDEFAFMKECYYLATTCYCIGLDHNMLGWFTTDELYNIWRIRNSHQCLEYAACEISKDVQSKRYNNLLLTFINEAEAALAGGPVKVTLGFGHDANLSPLMAQLRVKDCYTDATEVKDIDKHWATFHIVPLSCNFDFVLFRNAEGRVIVQTRLNERPMELPIQSVEGGFYEWPVLKAYIESRL